MTSPESRLVRLSNDRRVWAGTGALVVLAVLAIGIVAARGTGAAQPIAEQNGDVVSFAGSDPVTGKRVSLDDYASKPVVINVWGSWCPGCVAEAEDLRRFAEDHPEAQVLGVDLQDTKGAAKKFYERWRWTHPSVFDPDGEISFSLGLQGTPSLLPRPRAPDRDPHRRRDRLRGLRAGPASSPRGELSPSTLVEPRASQDGDAFRKLLARE